MLRIATFNNSYWLYDCATRHFGWRKTCPQQGIAPEILTPFLSHYQVTYKLVPYERAEIWQQIGGVWVNTMFEDLKAGKIDTIAQFYFNTKERREDFSFTNPVTQESLVFLVNGGSTDIGSHASIFFTVFDLYVWVCLLAFLLIYIVKRLILKSSFIRSHFLFLSRGSDVWLKIAVLVTAFTSVMFFSLYKGFLLGQLIYPPERVPIKDVPHMIELINNGKLKLVFDESLDYRYESIMYSKIPLLKQLRHALKNKPYVKITNGFDNNLIKNYLPTGEYAYPISSTDVSYVQSVACNMVPLQTPDLPFYKAGLMFRKNSTWIPIFNAAITKFSWHTENILNKYQGMRDWKAKRSCEAKEVKKKGMVALSLETMSGAFSVYGLSLGVGIAFMLFEVVSGIFGCKEKMEMKKKLKMIDRNRVMKVLDDHKCAHHSCVHRVLLCDHCVNVIVSLLQKKETLL